MAEPAGYVVELTASQWDLVIKSLEYVRARAYEPTGGNPQPIDIFARRLVRKSLDEIMAEILSNVPASEPPK